MSNLFKKQITLNRFQMNFRTTFKLQKELNQLNYNARLVVIGSCFSENINKKLSYYKFTTYSNPFGILFNPKAIENLIFNAVTHKQYTTKDIFKFNERWHSFDAHSDLSHENSDTLIQTLNQAICTTQQSIKNASHIIITFGTAWVYKLIETQKVVANCHKVPQKKFEKHLLSIDETIASLEQIINLVHTINPLATIIFTVSPVRHIKDGFFENSVSKSHLISAIHHLKAKNAMVYYFPSFEIMMDDLRDYRFYNSDMVHPNETAINYIWQQFQNVWIDAQTIPIQKEIETIQKGLLHKPFYPLSEQHQKFTQQLQHKILALQKQLPHITFE
jgi:lysophospholipase L1-like esterase